MTKPFQSIRDKVARLLGKSGPEETESSESQRLPAVDAATASAAPAAPAVKWEQPVAQQNWQQPQPVTSTPQSFADPGMDDLTIESRPVAQSARPVQTIPPAAKKDISVAPAESRHAGGALTPIAASMPAKPAPSFFDTRTAHADIADDTLLDLGDDPDLDSFAPANVAADDFFLDLGDEPSSPSRPLPEPVKAYERHLASRAAASVVAPAKQSLESTIHATAKSMNIEQLSSEMLDAITHRVIEQMSDKVIREIAWEVVPELADRLIKQRLDAEKHKA